MAASKADLDARAIAVGLTGSLSRSERDKVWQRMNEEESNRVAAEEVKALREYLAKTA